MDLHGRHAGVFVGSSAANCQTDKRPQGTRGILVFPRRTHSRWFRGKNTEGNKNGPARLLAFQPFFSCRKNCRSPASALLGEEKSRIFAPTHVGARSRTSRHRFQPRYLAPRSRKPRAHEKQPHNNSIRAIHSRPGHQGNSRRLRSGNWMPLELTFRAACSKKTKTLSRKPPWQTFASEPPSGLHRCVQMMEATDSPRLRRRTNTCATGPASPPSTKEQVRSNAPSSHGLCCASTRKIS